MALVDAEYVGEFAVLSAWLAALLPWSVSLSAPGGGTFFVVRFPLMSVRLLFGIEVEGEVPLLPVWRAADLPAPGSVATTAFTVWLAGAVVLGGALLISVVYYFRESSLETRLPVDPARLIGGLLAIGGGLLFISWLLLVLPAGLVQQFGIGTTAYAGITVPIGAVIVPVLGVVLLRTDRRLMT